MKVTLVSHTPNPEDLLIFTKQIRLGADPSRLDEIYNWSKADKQNELNYMVNTIKSSWEFVHFTFAIEGVGRGFTHQFVRNRQGSYAQQTMRMLDKSGFTYHTGPTIAKSPTMRSIYNGAMEDINTAYELLISLGAPIEDARGLLPTDIHTSLVVDYNLRTLSELVASRSSPRTQGEFRDVLDAMYYAVTVACPWAVEFLKPQKVEAAAYLDSFIMAHYDSSDIECTNLLKKVDLLRK